MTDVRPLRGVPTTAAIICSPRPSGTLQAVMEGIYAQSLAPAEVIVVQPATGRELVQWKARPGFRVITALGDQPAVQRNHGLRAATADLVAFFDDNSVPASSWFEELIPVFSSENACAATGGTTVDETRVDRPLVFRHGVINRRGVLDPIRLEAGPVPCTEDSLNVLDWANMLCYRAAVTQIGGYDEAFQSAWAEYDLCLRLWRWGWQVVHHTRAIVHLLQSRALQGPTEAVLTAAARDRTYFLRKHAGQSDFEAARRVLCAGRDQRRALRKAGAGAAAARQTFRAWSKGVRAGLALPLVARPPVAERTTDEKPSIMWQPARTAARLPSPRWQIALICGVFEAGHNGISEYTRLLAESLSQRGHGVAVFRTNRGPPLIDPRPYEVINVNPRPGELYQAAVGRYVFERHERLGVDLVEAPIWLGEACGIGLLAPYPVITRLVTPADVLHRTSQVSLERERANQMSMERLQLGISRGVIGISQAVCRTIEEVFGVRLSQPGRPLAVTPLGLPPIEESSLRAVPLPSSGRPVILYIGRLHQRKGILDLGEAFSRLAAADRQIQLWVLGRDYSHADGFRERSGMSYVQVLQQMWQGRVDGQAHLLGELGDAEKNFLISRSDVVVVPSWYESFGLVLLEAMRLGKPVVACAVGGMTEIVVDGETGLLVPPNDPPRLAEAIARLCRDAPLRRAMGAAALSRFERLYRLDRCVARTVEFYADVIGPT
jgi:glycogen synthase